MYSFSAGVNRFRSSQSLGRGLCWVVLVLALAWTPAKGAGKEAAYDTLLDKLHEKKILTDEEYQELKRAVQKANESEEREKAEAGENRQTAEIGEERENKIDKLLERLGGFEIGTLSYIDFSAGKEDDGDSFNRFAITRGYLNVKWKLNPWLGFRVTPDVHVDSDGNFNLRLKYLYAELRPPNLSFLTDMKSEIGIGHMPWLDLEEHINPYRVQGTMFIERAGIFNSSDLGVSLQGNIGGQIDADYQEAVSHYYPGRWGTWHIGVFNGGGYHSDESNQNKVPEWRISLRPLPDLLPGLQLHYFGLYGKGNTKQLDGFPDYQVNLAMLSYQNEWITFTGQYASARGNNKGSLVVPDTDRALREQGYSFFFNTKLPILDRKLNAFARYDHFDPDTKNWITPGDDSYNLAYAGMAWQFFRHWMVLLAYQRIFYEDNNAGLGAVPETGANLADDWRIQTALQIDF